MDKLKNQLDQIASNSLYTTVTNELMINYTFEVFSKYLNNGSILELGPAEGLMTQKLILATNNLTVVDGSKLFCERLKEQFPNINIIYSLFEDYEPKEKFDNIILGHVLEHVDNPILILNKCKEWIDVNGRILAAVPNSLSIHRQAAALMGIIDTEETMSDLDIHHGHKRIYNPISFRHDFSKSGFEILHYGGYWLKPLSDKQIIKDWTKEMIYAFMKLGERYPDIAAEIYIIAKPRMK